MQFHLTTCLCVQNPAGLMANSVDPDQTPRSAASDLGLHPLPSPVCHTTCYHGNSQYHNVRKYFEYVKLAWDNHNRYFTIL